MAVDQPVAATKRKVAPGTANGSAASRLEKMVAAKPSAENPFLTRKARLRRAKYILEHGAPEPLVQEVAGRAEAPSKESQSKPQPAYSFSKAKNPTRHSWKPATT